jgi:phosphocarrier protein
LNCCARRTKNWTDAGRRFGIAQKDGFVPERDVEIVNPQGIHARPAVQFVTTAKTFPCRVIVRSGKKVADGKSIMEMMVLAALPGTVLRIEAEGPQADACLDALAHVVAEFDKD